MSPLFAGFPAPWHALPVLLVALCSLAVAYRYYSAFLAARVAVLDDRRPTPAHTQSDGQNYFPTNRWVLFGHHFAAISGAGPLIGPVLAVQYGYLPPLLWLVIGVCLAGAVQDMLVLAASVRRGGKSLAEIARVELGPWAYGVVSVAILFIVVIALAGLGFVVVKALGGEEIVLPAGTLLTVPDGDAPTLSVRPGDDFITLKMPPGSKVAYGTGAVDVPRSEGFAVAVPRKELDPAVLFPGRDGAVPSEVGPLAALLKLTRERRISLPPGCRETVKGSSWGVFTIACTIPIAFFVGWYMYRFRVGRVLEASLIGAALVLVATVVGGRIPGSSLEPYFLLTKTQAVLALTGYGFIAAVLPVWMLLCPRDYLSSFLKVGTIILLVLGVCLANPVLQAPPLNPVFQDGGPTLNGPIFPFVFICVMCGSVSGFHALVSSGTTPKMIDKESDVRLIGYGAMLMECVVGLVALVAAASLDPKLYFEINTGLAATARWQGQLDELNKELSAGGLADLPAVDRDLGDVERMVGGESLRGRTGGAVTLAVGMSFILTDASRWAVDPAFTESLIKYWYHFAIMFEALFILTTIDTGTRISRFLLQEVLGRIHPQLGRVDWLPGAALASAVVTAGWGALVATGSIETIWPMFGVANQLLAVLALALVTTWLINTGRGRYAPITLAPMAFVTATTMTAGVQLVTQSSPQRIRDGQIVTGVFNIALTVFVMASVATLLLIALARWVAVLRGIVPTRRD